VAGPELELRPGRGARCCRLDNFLIAGAIDVKGRLPMPVTALAGTKGDQAVCGRLSVDDLSFLP
jgi:hypothetical protein